MNVKFKRVATATDMKNLKIFPGSTRRPALRFSKVVLATDMDPDG